MSKDWYLMTNRHLSGYEKEEFEKTYNVFDEILQQSPEAYDITIDGQSKTAIIQSTSDPLKRTLLFENGEVSHGDIVEFDNQKWLVLDYPYNNKIYTKSVMQLCNETLVFEVPKEPIDYTSDGRPIYDDNQPNVIHIPCVVQNLTEYNADNNEPINIAEAEGTILVSYPNIMTFYEGMEFDLYGFTNRVIGFDRRRIVDGKGALAIITKKIR